MVRDVQPVALLAAVAVERQRPILDGVGDEERDELLGKLVRAIRVGAPCDDDIEVVRRVVAQRQQLPGGLGGGVGRPRGDRVALRREARLDRAVDLVGRDLQEARGRHALAARGTQRLAKGSLEQDMDARYAGVQEGGRVVDAPIDVRLGGEVDDGVDLLRQISDQPRVGDVAAHEGQSSRPGRIRIDLRQIVASPGVRQEVEDGDSQGRIVRQRVAHEGRADEAGPTRHQEVGAAAAGKSVGGHGRCGGGASLPAASSSAAKWAAS